MIDRNDRNGRHVQVEAADNRQERTAADYGLLDGHIIYVGALSCMRHRGQEFTQLQREGRLSYLILNEIDYISGDYLEKIKDAAREIAAEEHPSALNLAVGCQGALLSTDYRMLIGELEKELSIPVRIDENCHLLGYDHHGRHGGRGEHGDWRNHGSRGDHDSHEYHRHHQEGTSKGRFFDLGGLRKNKGRQEGETGR